MIRRWVLPLAFVVASLTASAEDLGRLFFSPQERESMDRQRRGEKAISNSASAALNGYIKRSDGRNTIWVDGSPVRATDKQIDQTVVDGTPGAAPGVHIKQSKEPDAKSKAPAPETPRKRKQPPRKVPQPAG